MRSHRRTSSFNACVFTMHKWANHNDKGSKTKFFVEPYENKKALLRERKRHTDRGVGCTLLDRVPPLLRLGQGTPQPGQGTPHPQLGQGSPPPLGRMVPAHLLPGKDGTPTSFSGRMVTPTSFLGRMIKLLVKWGNKSPTVRYFGCSIMSLSRCVDNSWWVEF